MKQSRNLRGIVTMICAVSLLSLMDAGLKQLSPHYPPLQVASMRALASWPLITAWALANGGAASLLRVRWPLHVFRGVIGVATLSVFIYSLRYLPLTTAYTLFFVAPLIITVLSALILREQVGPRRWIAILAGFSGVLVALHPSGEGLFTWAGVGVLVASAGYAISAITVRILGRTDSTQSMVFWVLTFMGVGGAALAAPGWTPIQPQDWIVMAAVGLFGGLGQYALTDAFARAEASVIAPFEYSALAWGVGFDALVWGVLPGAITWVGAAIIVASGLYLMRHERVRIDLPEAQIQP